MDDRLQRHFCCYGVCRALDRHAKGCRKFTPAQIVEAKLRGTLKERRKAR